jgi:hypothetical protein
MITVLVRQQQRTEVARFQPNPGQAPRDLASGKAGIDEESSMLRLDHQGVTLTPRS